VPGIIHSDNGTSMTSKPVRFSQRKRSGQTGFLGHER
jgi:hypothetical protein